MTGAIQKSAGDYLLSHFWGGYAALVLNPHGKDIHVLRDPSGAMPMYYVGNDGLLALSTDAETLHDAGLLAPEIDWNGLFRHLIAYDLRNEGTCLTGVNELLAGHRITFGHRQYQLSCRWMPASYCKSVRPPDAAEAAERIREVTSATINAWAADFQHIVMGVSGGLDSSIVTLALQGHETRLTCYTLITDEAVGDERRYASQLEPHLTSPLLTFRHRADRVDFELCTSAHLPRPIGHAFGQSTHQARLDLAARTCADAFFSGIGGDNVFFYTQSALPILDRLMHEGPGTGVLKTLDDVCALTGCSYADAIRLTASRFATRNDGYRWRADAQFLDKELVAKSAPLSHPWLEGSSALLPGKAAHVAMLARIQGTLDAGLSRRHPPQINPLVSQPIMEECLKIPSWMWISGGYNRSVVRRGFADRLPPALLNRRGKGGSDNFVYEVIASQRDRLRGMLLEGALARHGLIDRSSIDLALGIDGLIPANGYLRLSALAETENWLRVWLDRGLSKPRPAQVAGGKNR